MIPFVWNSQKLIICGEEKIQNNDAFWGIGDKELTGKGHEETFWSDKNILYHDRSLELQRFMHLLKLSKWTKLSCFIVCKFYNRRQSVVNTIVFLLTTCMLTYNCAKIWLCFKIPTECITRWCSGRYLIKQVCKLLNVESK